MEISALPKDKKIVLFDGVCNLCNSSVQYIIKHDRKDLFRFVALQSDFGKEIIRYLGIENRNIDSIVLYEPGKAYYYKAEAALRIISELDSFFSILKIFLVIPSVLSNVVYDFIAKNRYNWYGKRESCMIPTEELKSKFLE